MSDVFERFTWHSSIGIDDSIKDSKKFVSRIANTKEAMVGFVVAGENLLIHKSTKALWKISEDGKYIEPVFDEDILTEDDLEG